MYQSEEGSISNTHLTEQKDIKAAVDTKLATINKKKVYNITNWRLPTLSELKYISNHYDELRTAIGLGSFIKKGSNYNRYYCTDTNGDITGYTFYNDTVIEPLTNGTASYINGFAIIKYTN